MDPNTDGSPTLPGENCRGPCLRHLTDLTDEETSLSTDEDEAKACCKKCKKPNVPVILEDDDDATDHNDDDLEDTDAVDEDEETDADEDEADDADVADTIDDDGDTISGTEEDPIPTTEDEEPEDEEEPEEEEEPAVEEMDDEEQLPLGTQPPSDIPRNRTHHSFRVFKKKPPPESTCRTPIVFRLPKNRESHPPTVVPETFLDTTTYTQKQGEEKTIKHTPAIGGAALLTGKGTAVVLPGCPSKNCGPKTMT